MDERDESGEPCEVYVGLSADVLHHGHIRLLAAARGYGKVTVGLLTDSAVRGHKRIPALNYSQRAELLLGLANVSAVVPQHEWTYEENIRLLRPRYFVHGDDWIDGPDSNLRPGVIHALGEYGGILIEIPSAKGVSSERLRAEYALMAGGSPSRVSVLKRVIEAEGFCRVIECHSPLVALLVDQIRVSDDGRFREFDALWSGSLSDSVSVARPDNEELTLTERIRSIDRILDVSNKPLVVDGDTGGQTPHLISHCKTLVRMGISAVVIEDKTGLKQNSLLGSSPLQEQLPAKEFSTKIQAVRSAIPDNDFMLVARIESLVLGKTIEDALVRAESYVGSGADAILIHSKATSPVEILEFADKFRRLNSTTPLVCVPSTYSNVTEGELRSAGFQMVIYANQVIRSIIPSISLTLTSILANESSRAIEQDLLPIENLINLIK